MGKRKQQMIKDLWAEAEHYERLVARDAPRWETMTEMEQIIHKIRERRIKKYKRQARRLLRQLREPMEERPWL